MTFFAPLHCQGCTFSFQHFQDGVPLRHVGRPARSRDTRRAGTEDKIWHTMLPIAYSTWYPPQIPSYLLFHSLSTVTNLLCAALFVGRRPFCVALPNELMLLVLLLPAASPCARPWTSYEGKCYMIPSVPGTPASCSTICQEAAAANGSDASLACVTSMDEQSFIGDLIPASSGSAWVGNYRQRVVQGMPGPHTGPLPAFDQCSSGARPQYSPSFWPGEPTDHKFEVNLGIRIDESNVSLAFDGWAAPRPVRSTFWAFCACELGSPTTLEFTGSMAKVDAEFEADAAALGVGPDAKTIPTDVFEMCFDEMAHQKLASDVFPKLRGVCTVMI